MALTIGVLICYLELYVVNLDWFVASAVTVDGAVVTGLESEEAIRAAACSKREQERRSRVAR